VLRYTRRRPIPPRPCPLARAATLAHRAAGGAGPSACKHVVGPRPQPWTGPGLTPLASPGTGNVHWFLESYRQETRKTPDLTKCGRMSSPGPSREGPSGTLALARGSPGGPDRAGRSPAGHAVARAWAVWVGARNREARSATSDSKQCFSSVCSVYVSFAFTFRNEGAELDGTGDSIDLHKVGLL